MSEVSAPPPPDATTPPDGTPHPDGSRRSPDRRHIRPNRVVINRRRAAHRRADTAPAPAAEPDPEPDPTSPEPSPLPPSVVAPPDAGDPTTSVAPRNERLGSKIGRKAGELGWKATKKAGELGWKATKYTSKKGWQGTKWAGKKGYEKGGNLWEASGGAKGIGKSVVDGMIAYGKNMNILEWKNRDLVWKIGAGVGVIEGVAADYLLPPPWGRYARTGVNLAVTHGGLLGLRMRNDHQIRKIHEKYAGSTDSDAIRDAEIAAREKGFSTGSKRIEQFMLGVSAGITVASLGEIGFEAAKPLASFVTQRLQETGMRAGAYIQEKIGGAKLGEMAAGAKAVYDRLSPQIKPGLEALGKEIGKGVPMVHNIIDGNGQKVIDDAVAKVGETWKDFNERTGMKFAAMTFGPDVDGLTPEGYQDYVSGSVGQIVDRTNTLTDLKIAELGLDPHKVAQSTYEEVRSSVQRAMEEKANKAFEKAAAQFTGENGQVDLVQAARRGREIFFADSGQPQFGAELGDVAQQSITDSAAAEAAIQSSLNEVFSGANVAEVAIPSGSTLGNVLAEHGHPLTNTVADADIYGAHLAINFDRARDAWAQVAEANPSPEMAHFPVALTEIPELIQQAQGGEVSAFRRLLDALQFIPANEKVKILTDAGLQQLFGEMV